MSAVALAAEAAPHPEPPRAAAGARPRDGGTSIRVPLRLVVGAQYADAALSAYVKVAALALRPEGCTAKVAVMAEYLGMSKSAVERGLRQLARPDDVDGLVEVPTVRRTLPGGRGQSAHRVVRALAPGELWVRIPVRAAEALTPRLLRLYALLVYALARRIPVTATELGELLRHHTGKRAGEHLGERQARRLVDELESTGWLTVHRREGEQGRHAYEPHRHPLHSVPAPVEVLEDQAAEQGTGAPVIHDGSGPDLGDGSLASREDLGTGRQEKKSGVGGGIRRRRSTGSRPAAPADSTAPTGPDTFGRGPGALRADTPAPPVVGPAISSEEWATVWAVISPVAHTLTDLSSWEWARVVREIHHQVTTGTATDRLADRIRRRMASTETIVSTGRWLLGVALVRRGCRDPRCESGVIWSDHDDHEQGRDCRTCQYTREAEATQAQRMRDLEESERRVAARRAELMRAAEQQPSAKASYRERAATPEWEIRAAIRTLGAAHALHRYGALRVLPLLDDPGAAEAEQAEPVMPGLARIRELAGRARTAVRATPASDLAGACPTPTCRALPGQPCTTPRGRRRAFAHSARPTAADGGKETTPHAQ